MPEQGLAHLRECGSLDLSTLALPALAKTLDERTRQGSGGRVSILSIDSMVLLTSELVGKYHRFLCATVNGFIVNSQVAFYYLCIIISVRLCKSASVYKIIKYHV